MTDDSTIYGCTSADFTSRNGRPVPNAVYAAWTEEVGGEPVTGLLTIDGEPLDPILSDDDGGVRFRDPRNGRDPIWIDTGWGRRIAVMPLDKTGPQGPRGIQGPVGESIGGLLTTKGDIAVGQGSGVATRQPAGADGSLVVYDSAASTGLSSVRIGNRALPQQATPAAAAAFIAHVGCTRTVTDGKLQLTSTGGYMTAGFAHGSSGQYLVPVVPGETLTAVVSSKAGSTPRSGRVSIAFYAADATTFIAESPGRLSPNHAYGLTEHRVSGVVVPGGAALAAVWWHTPDTTVAGETHSLSRFGIWSERPLGAWAMPGRTVIGMQPVILAPTWLEVWGHSYAAGSGGSAGRVGFGEAAAERLGLPLRCRARGGSSISDDPFYPQFLCAIDRADRFTIPTNLNVMMYGVNDVTLVADAAAVTGNVTQAIEMAVSRMRSGSRPFPYTDASFGWSGAWYTSSNTTSASGGWKYAVATSAAYTITTPADFPGGTVAIGIASQAPLGAGAVHTASIAGTPVASITAKSTFTGTGHYYVLRVPNVAAGANTIGVALSDFGSGSLTAVDCWWWECPPDQGPVVVLVEQPLLTATGYAAFTDKVNDAKINALNAFQHDVAARFGDRVLVANSHRPAMDKATSYFAADQVHPSNRGHDLIAQAVIDALTGAAVIAAGAGSGRNPRWKAAAPPTAAPNSSWGWNTAGTVIENSAPAELGSAGSKYVVTGWVCTATGGPGTWLPMRVLTGN